MPQIIQIDANTWRFEDGFVRFFLLVGKEQAALIDSGVNCHDAAQLAGELTDKPIILLNTHADPDHISGTGGFSRIHIHLEEYAGSNLPDRFPGTEPAFVQDGDILELGDRPLKILHIPGHTRGSIAVLDTKARTLYAGDSVQKGHIFMFGRRRAAEDFEASLQKLIGLQGEYDRICASHDAWLLPGNYAEQVCHAWQQARRGELPAERIEMFGAPVLSCSADACGFYLDVPERAL